MAVGFGFFVEMTHDEALRFIEKKTSQLTASVVLLLLLLVCLLLFSLFFFCGFHNSKNERSTILA